MALLVEEYIAISTYGRRRQQGNFGGVFGKLKIIY